MGRDEEFLKILQSVGAVKPTAPTEGSFVEETMAQGDPDFSTPVSLRNLFTHHDTHPVVLMIALFKSLGPLWIEWETKTIWSEVTRLFGTAISEHNRAKIQAVRALITSDMPWTSWHVFEKIVQVLNNNLPDFNVMQAPSLEQLFVAVDIMRDVNKMGFSQEVKHYMAAAVLNEDVFYTPFPLDDIQVEVAQPHYLCKDCGNESSGLFHDGYCDVCTNRFSIDHGFSMKPSAEAVAAGKGKNLELVVKFDPEPIKKRYEEVERKPISEINLEETMVDVQVAKLIMARDYVNLRRKQLVEQLTTLKAWLETL